MRTECVSDIPYQDVMRENNMITVVVSVAHEHLQQQKQQY